MTSLTQISPPGNDLVMLKLAREIAMDIRPLEDILATYKLDQAQWEELQANSYFQGVLNAEAEAWQSAMNTSERVKLKTLAMVEESLPEFYARMHDQKEPLNAKVELLKTVAKFGGIGGSNFDGSVNGERLSVTINLGADHSLKIEKELPAKVIEHEDAE